jgi:biotin-(acetyl-CoA carboxylase) ligase
VTLDDWLSHTRGIGEQITVRNGEAEMQGRFVGLDRSGRLMLEVKGGGIKTISAGDVFLFAVRGQRDNKDPLGRPG